MKSADALFLCLEDASIAAISYADGARLDVAFASGAKIVGHVRRSTDEDPSWCKWVSVTAWFSSEVVPCEQGVAYFATREDAAAATTAVLLFFMPNGEKMRLST